MNGLYLSATQGQKPVAEAAANAMSPKDRALNDAASDFEAAFLAEMFEHIGLDAARGVAGAEAFSSFLNRAYAEQLTDRGGIGLTESLFRSLQAQNERDTDGTGIQD